MPQRSDGSRKRLRIEEAEAGPSNITNQEELGRDIPAWVYKLMKKPLLQVGDIAKNICKKQVAIQKLEEHVSKGTCPPSLRINILAKVTEDHQNRMDKTIQAATTVFQETILRELVKIRSQELEDMTLSIQDLKEKVINEMKTTLDQMEEEKLLDNGHDLLKKYKEIFIHKTEELLLKIRTADFHQRKEEIKKKAVHFEKRADVEMEETLADPDLTNLKKKVTMLESKITNMTKKDKGKPGKKTPNSGKASKKDHKGKGNGKPSKKKKSKDNQKKGSESGKGNQGQKSGSRNTTDRSDSRRRTSQKKQN